MLGAFGAALQVDAEAEGRSPEQQSILLYRKDHGLLMSDFISKGDAPITLCEALGATRSLCSETAPICMLPLSTLERQKRADPVIQVHLLPPVLRTSPCEEEKVYADFEQWVRKHRRR